MNNGAISVRNIDKAAGENDSEYNSRADITDF